MHLSADWSSKFNLMNIHDICRIKENRANCFFCCTKKPQLPGGLFSPSYVWKKLVQSILLDFAFGNGSQWTRMGFLARLIVWLKYYSCTYDFCIPLDSLGIKDLKKIKKAKKILKGHTKDHTSILKIFFVLLTFFFTFLT